MQIILIVCNFNFMLFISILCLFSNLVYCFQADWELNQFETTKPKSIKFFSNIKSESKGEAIKANRILINQYISQQSIPGIVIGISIKGKTVWTEAFGYMDIENNLKTDKKSVWRLASISKPLTSALVAQLIDKKLLDLDEPIHKHLSKDLFPIKGYEGKGVKITLRQLLSHTAGLHVTKIPDDFSNIFKAQNVSQTLKKLKNEKLLSRPGREYNYSNYGYQVAGAVIEAVLKNTYQNEIKKMCVSLGMNSTFAEPPEHIYKHRPSYYQPSPTVPGQLERADIIDDLFSYEGWWPSGGMVSTVDDLLIFGNEILSAFKGKKKNFLSQSIVKELWKPETIGKPKGQNMNDNEYGKGWVIKHLAKSIDYPYKTLLWHSGGLLGTSTMLFIFPDVDIVGVGFANKGSILGLDQIVLLVAKSFEFLIK